MITASARKINASGEVSSALYILRRHEENRAVFTFCFLHDNRKCLRFFRRENAGSAFAENSRFLRGDFPDRLAKKLLMIFADARNHGKIRDGQRICSVLQAAHSRFDNEKLRFPFLKPEKAEQEQKLKIRRMQLLPSFTQFSRLFETFRECRLGNHLPVKRHALSRRDQMRRRKNTGMIPLLP